MRVFLTSVFSGVKVWCGCGKKAKIAIFDTETLAYTLLPIKTLQSSVALTKMALIGNEVLSLVRCLARTQFIDV